MDTVFTAMARHGVVPVIAIDSADAAIKLADALIEGGLPVAEVTFRTAAAAAVIEKLAVERPQLLLGAGTVLTEENLHAARESGAQFAVAPGLNPSIVAAAAELGLPFMPGVATPSEVEQGLALGCTMLKLFPASNLGGPAYLKALAGPYAHTGVRFVPLGGVSLENLASYLEVPIVAAVGGSWLAKKDDIAKGEWAAISRRCRESVTAVKTVRGAE